MKIAKMQLGNFLDVIQGKVTPQEKLIKFKNKTEWFKNIGDGYSRVINIQEKENILESIITVEVWDIQQFTPVHCYVYSVLAQMMQKVIKLKQIRNLNKF